MRESRDLEINYVKTIIMMARISNESYYLKQARKLIDEFKVRELQDLNDKTIILEVA